ncbi:MAG: ribosomal RNA small subunit methyltransferase A [Candidatus Magasanikbacteria bacterium CG10_big_fil_rev_8_21_14_0_10_42_10]|uniref:Ribosomal RNA small subunit methyltransferase A n=2 Tax=Candidatus Magasanikiibacteriota TaxID=1752731 RepID=A0A2H0TXI5_9BACT|nr:MAG: ribosomal RNA small subunit methyltransferase A [Candidatus Magasanikbacteria bacterium CG10_big_fil_rev_8_21_14_0_10_42_10]PIZ94457.1 MAG: ribosomal RNA small subunit methyltransferase A [Candidatus Magasanikbacteria bacterium CG_4_10_14_0_2_um_filter_41_10]
MSSFLSPSKLKELCTRYHLTPSKKYGQNYLISETPINKMIEAGELTSNDTVVEIGPGFGVLTFALSPLVKKVVAFEIEKKLEEYWEEKQKEYKNIQVIWGNALKELHYSNSELRTPYKVLANLPYQITSHVLRTLLELPQKSERIVIMVQKEVAERICAKAGEMSLLSVSVQYYGTPKIVTKVTKGNFWPSPNVDSAVIAVTHMKDRPDAEVFFHYVRAGFQNKRKQVWKNLSQAFHLDGEQVKQVLVEVTGDEKVRAQELSVMEWEEVVQKLKAF